MDSNKRVNLSWDSLGNGKSNITYIRLKEKWVPIMKTIYEESLGQSIIINSSWDTLSHAFTPYLKTVTLYDSIFTFESYSYSWDTLKNDGNQVGKNFISMMI